MATFGKIEEYDNSEDWRQHVERLENYFEADDIQDDDAGKRKQRAILLTVCGPTMYKMIRDLVAPAQPKEMTFTELAQLVEKHMNPAPSVIVSRFKFHSRKRKAGESVSAFVAELRHLMEHCQYAEKLAENLRDQLVLGVNNEQIQRRLLAENDLTLEKALDIAISMETAASNAADIAKTTPGAEAAVNAVKYYPQKGKFKSCYRCKRAKHDPNKCPFKEAECHKCNKIGHIAPACRSRN